MLIGLARLETIAQMVVREDLRRHVEPQRLLFRLPLPELQLANMQMLF
jgi:hypothetical protein